MADQSLEIYQPLAISYCHFDCTLIRFPHQISTINLCLMRATFISETQLAANMGFFVLTFFAFRIVLCPYLWWGIFRTSWDNRDNPESQACLPWHFKYVTFAFGMFFNCLNSFWFYKILRKLRRKLSGEEKVKERNKHSTGTYFSLKSVSRV